MSIARAVVLILHGRHCTFINMSKQTNFSEMQLYGNCSSDSVTVGLSFNRPSHTLGSNEHVKYYYLTQLRQHPPSVHCTISQNSTYGRGLYILNCYCTHIKMPKKGITAKVRNTICAPQAHFSCAMCACFTEFSYGIKNLQRSTLVKSVQLINVRTHQQQT